jgi:5'-deoxynucleotidase YfbR-like HD superfamily hydrolase
MSGPQESKVTGRAWQRMLSGRRLDLLNPSPADIEIDDIAHGLARVARWNGQTIGAHAFSVAQHALVVEDIFSAIGSATDVQMPAIWRLAALLHDAPEYVVGDLISPFKTAIGLDYKAFELRLLAAIHARYGLPAELPSDVQAQIYFGQPKDLAPELTAKLAALAPEPADAAQRNFLNRFNLLIERF